MNSIDVAEAIERFAYKLAETLENRASGMIDSSTAYVLEAIATDLREASKTNRTRRAERRAEERAREAEEK